jgi:hypothetical protein
MDRISLKKSFVYIGLVITFLGCTDCYECRYIQKTTPTVYGQPQSTLTFVEQCGLTPRQARKFEEQATTQATVIVGNKTYTSTTTVFCNPK